MSTSFKFVLLGALGLLISISALGIGYAYFKEDHSREIKLLQNARIGAGNANTKPRSSQSITGAQPGHSVGAHGNAPAAGASSEDVMSIGYSLMSDKDASVRAGCADALGRVAAFENRGSTEFGPREAQMIDLMVAAYHSEKDDRVRVQIVTNAGSFNHPQAESLLVLGLEDPVASVRAAAGQAKQTREKRLVLNGTGDIKPRVWR